MRVMASPGGLERADGWLALGSVWLLGIGALVGLAGVGADDTIMAVAGGAVVAGALTMLMAYGSIDPLAVLILSLPLPALFLAGDIRLAPAAPTTLLVITAWFLARGPSHRDPIPANVPYAALAAFLGSYALAGLFTEHRAAAAREIVNLAVLGTLLLVAADIATRKRMAIDRIPPLIALVAGITGALAMLEFAGVLPGRFPEPSGVNRAALGFGQPNGLGMFLALCLPLTAHVRLGARTRFGRLAGSLALAMVAGGIVATLSRGSAISILAGAAVLALAGAWRKALRIWTAAVLVALGAELVTGGVVFETVAGLLEDWSVVQRAALMLAGIRLFLEHPLVGVGPGGFAEELDRVGVLVPTLWDLRPTPHNAYVQVAAEAGLIGLAGFLVFLGAALRRLLRAAREEGVTTEERGLRLAVLWTFGVALAEGMVEWPLSHGHGQLVMLVIAMGIAATSAKSSRPAQPALTGDD